MDIIVEFYGGILDGVTYYSDSPDELTRQKVVRIAQVVGGCLRDAEQREVAFQPDMLYSVPSQEVVEVATRENWSEARIKALMPYYVYEFWRVKEQNRIAHISLRYREVNQ
jgi:hypothetical protein